MNEKSTKKFSKDNGHAEINHGAIELAGSSTGKLFPTDTINSSLIGNNCPPTDPKPRDPSGQAVAEKLLAICEKANEYGLYRMSDRIHCCCFDVILLYERDGTIGFTLQHCNHLLCPVCHAYYSYKIRSRLKKVIERAHLMITLTMATYTDSKLREYIDQLRKAFRMLTQDKQNKKWRPFDSGYYWHLEVTHGKAYHPHLHVLSCHDWIPYEQLRDRWRKCLDYVGAKGDLVWINAMSPNTLHEVTKYLTKDINLIPAHRWEHLLTGLKGVQKYGSGGALRLPPLETSGKHFACFGRQVDRDSDAEKWLRLHQPDLVGAIRPDSPYFKRYSDNEYWKEYYEVDWHFASKEIPF